MRPQAEFLAEIKGHRSSIADFLGYCERGELTVTDRVVMLERARSIAEAAAAYGYAKVAGAARALESALLADTPTQALINLTQALHEACHDALVVLPSSGLVQLPSSGRRFFDRAEKPRLLIADDDRAVRAIIHNLFTRHAYIIEAADGIAAMSAIRLYRPDLVLLDDTMPEMTGLTLIEKIHADPELVHTNVIMLTSSDGDRDLARAFDAGACDYIIKPFDPEVLSEKVYGFFRRFGKRT